LSEAVSGARVHAEGPWRVALRKLARDRAAIAALAVLVALVLACLAAPLYARHVAHVDPFRPNLDGQVVVGGRAMDILQPADNPLHLGSAPIGPTWHATYFLGADNQGRDVAARLLYGGRNSLLIAGTATLLCLTLAAIVGITAGFLGGVVDQVLSRLLDILWAFPVYLLAISLSIVLISQGLRIGPITIQADSLVLPIAIIGIVYVPYAARPIRGQVLGLRRSEFVAAAEALGVPRPRILWRDVLPNVSSTLVVFAPLIMALNLLTESALSFLSIGVQPPAASWGTIIGDGQELIYTRPLVAIAPGLCVVVTVLALNVLGDGLRDALDPRAKLREQG
jgi:peptide/nickel transport system permease protein